MTVRATVVVLVALPRGLAVAADDAADGDYR